MSPAKLPDNTCARPAIAGSTHTTVDRKKASIETGGIEIVMARAGEFGGRWIRAAVLTALLSAMLSSLTWAATNQDPTPADQPIDQAATDAAIDAWRAKRFGMFVHWGPVAIRGTEIGWSRGGEVPSEEYDQLYK